MPKVCIIIANSCLARPFIIEMLSERLYDGTCVNTVGQGLREEGSLFIVSSLVYKFSCFLQASGIGHIWHVKHVIVQARLLNNPPYINTQS